MIRHWTSISKCLTRRGIIRNNKVLRFACLVKRLTKKRDCIFILHCELASVTDVEDQNFLSFHSLAHVHQVVMQGQSAHYLTLEGANLSHSVHELVVCPYCLNGLRRLQILQRSKTTLELARRILYIFSA